MSRIVEALFFIFLRNVFLLFWIVWLIGHDRSCGKGSPLEPLWLPLWSGCPGLLPGLVEMEGQTEHLSSIQASAVEDWAGGIEGLASGLGQGTVICVLTQYYTKFHRHLTTQLLDCDFWALVSSLQPNSQLTSTCPPRGTWALAGPIPHTLEPNVGESQPRVFLFPNHSPSWSAMLGPDWQEEPLRASHLMLHTFSH